MTFKSRKLMEMEAELIELQIGYCEELILLLQSIIETYEGFRTSDACIRACRKASASFERVAGDDYIPEDEHGNAKQFVSLLREGRIVDAAFEHMISVLRRGIHTLRGRADDAVEEQSKPIYN